MLSELIKMWKRIGRLDKALKNFLKMIDKVEGMFRCSTEALFGARKLADARETIYHTDIKVNKRERKIRKELVEHLSVNPRGDAPACLILMSVSKDMERAGDYCKNLLEVAGMLKTPAMETKYADDLREMADLVTASFTQTRRAFAEEDHTVANEVIVEERTLAKASDAMVEKIANDDDLDANQAVCLALGFRFLKRVNAHLGNVASTVIMPLHKIDYFDEKLAVEPAETGEEMPAGDEAGPNAGPGDEPDNEADGNTDDGESSA
jgi:phosphate uptake regulator